MSKKYSSIFQNNLEMATEYKIPQELRKFPKVRILRPYVDLGPITKLLPGIEYARSRDKDALVITVDDDVGYPKGAISELIYHSVKNQNTVVSGSGQDAGYWIGQRAMPATTNNGWEIMQNNSSSRADWNTPPSYCDVVEGFGGIGYRANMVDIELMKYLSSREFSKFCFVSDDLVISYVLALSGVNRLKIQNQYLHINLAEKFNIHFFFPGLHEDALHRGGGLEGIDLEGAPSVNFKKYSECLKKLRETSWDATAQRFKTAKQMKSELFNDFWFVRPAYIWEIGDNLKMWHYCNRPLQILTFLWFLFKRRKI